MLLGKSIIEREITIGIRDYNYIVADSLNPAEYDDISDSPENWDKYGEGLIGTVTGFKDWMCLREIIKPLINAICGADYANFDLLNDAQKLIALKYFPTKIIGAQGFPFFASKAGGVEMAFLYIDNFLKNAEVARASRYTAYMSFGYQYLGAIQGLKAESLLRADFLDVTFVKRGVLYFQEDQIPGLANWTISDTSFITTGLKARILSGEFVLGGGMDVNTFINTLINIVENGSY